MKYIAFLAVLIALGSVSAMNLGKAKLVSDSDESRFAHRPPIVGILTQPSSAEMPGLDSEGLDSS